MIDKIRVSYDDLPSDVLLKVNEILQERGIGFIFENDNEAHDGYEIYVVKSV